MQIGDYVYDSSLGQRGIIIEIKKWINHPSDEPELEHTILYEDGKLDHAYEGELKVINESR